METALRPTQREFKGKSSILDLSDYIVVDIETTGLDPGVDEIIELSAIRVRNNKKEIVFQSLVKPIEEIDEFITELTGITNEMLESAPIIEDVLPHFLDFVNSDVIVGHNVNFDINFIYDHSLKTLEKPFLNNFVDTLRLARKIFPDSPNHKLITLAKYLKLNTTPIHRGLADCEVTLELYQTITNYIKMNELNLSVLFKPKYGERLAKQITTTKTIFNEEHSLFGKYCVFTGALQKMLRKDAMQIVVDLGGYCADSVNKKTNYLILGNLDYCKTVKDDKSNKLKRAEELILSGQDLEIISENVFYDLILDNQAEKIEDKFPDNNKPDCRQKEATLLKIW